MKSLSTLLFLFLTFISRSQSQTSSHASESHNFVTYDTTFNLGYGNLSYVLRITRPVNMFTANSPDTASRPAIIHMAGTAQIGSNAALSSTYGPHYLLANGWDGGIPLGNGRHYPIIISVQPNIVWPQTNELYTVLNYILKTYHIKKNSVHLSGMDMGACAWTALICHQASAGAESGMKLVTSLVALQGQSNSVSIAVQPYELGGTASYASFGHWAKKYKGKYFGLEGAGDNGRYLWKVQQPMNDSMPGSAYFAYENYGGGAHCCWNSMYDTAVTDWQSVAPITNTNVKTDNYYPNSMGAYKKGSNIFQWMLRQGDTSLVAASTANTTAPTVTVTSAASLTLPVNTMLLTGKATPATGTTIARYAWTQVSGPASVILTPSLPVTTVESPSAGTYVYKLTVTSNTGATASSTLSFKVNPAAAILAPVVNASSALSITLPLNTMYLTGKATPAKGTTIALYAWTQVSGPSSLILTPSLANTTVVSTTAGTYVYKLTVTSNTGATASSTVTFKVNPDPITAILAPVVSAGAALSITLPASQVSLSGSATDPNGGTIKTYAWKQTSGTTAGITSPSSATTSITGLTQGNYVFTLTATTSEGSSASSNVSVTVNAAATGGTGGLTVKKVIVCEYRTWYIASDGNVYGFNNFSPKVMQFPIGGRKAIDGAGAFNEFRILDDQGYIWQSVIDFNIVTKRYDVDATGAAFNGNIAVYDYANTTTTIRSDGSVWYFGDDTFHLFHSKGLVAMKPTRLSPAGMVVKKIAMGGTRIVALTTAGDVYEWVAGKGTTPVKKTIPSPAIDIFASHLDYAGCLIPASAGATTGYPYVWGYYFRAWGGNAPYTQPTSVQKLWGVASPIRTIDVNWNTTHYIDDQNRMWGLGFNVQGEVGLGYELVNQYDYSAPYSWTFEDGVGFSGVPAKQIGAGVQWSQLFSNNWFAFYKYALDVNGNLYSWGRNKAIVLGNGFLNMQEQYTPNSMDVLVPRKVTPLTTTFQEYNFTMPTISAGANQTISTATATLKGTATPPLLMKNGISAANGINTVGFNIVSYQWTTVSGKDVTFTTPNSPVTTVTGLKKGTYVFALMTTDNNNGTQRATVTVTVNSTTTADDGAVSARAGAATLDSTRSAFGLYPNPARDNFILALNNNYTGTMNVQLINESGAVMKTWQLNKNQQTSQNTLSVSNLAAGAYFIRVRIGSWSEMKKLLKL